MVPTNWGELWPLHRVVATLVSEQVHHGAEISLMRDLYRNRGSTAAAAGRWHVRPAEPSILTELFTAR